MKIFYEVRRQLMNRSRWMSEGFFEKKEDAQQFIDKKTKFLESKELDDKIIINFAIIEQKMFTSKDD